MNDFVYTRERKAGPVEWWFVLTGKTPRERRASLGAAEAAYQRRFRRTIPAPHRIARIGKAIMLAYQTCADTHIPFPLLEGKATPEIVTPVQLTMEVL